MRARGCIWLAMTYELFSLYEPESINIPMLTRLTSSNMQGFFCPCAWNVVYDTEMNSLIHMRSKHPTVQRALLVVRRSTDPYEYDQFTFPTNRFINTETLKDIKQRLCKLSGTRKRLPLIKEEREIIASRKATRSQYLQMSKVQ